MPRRINKEDKELLSPKPWFIREVERKQAREDVQLETQRAKLRERQSISIILSVAIPILIALTLAIIVCDGMNLLGLDIDTTTINILASTVIPEALGLIAIALRGIWGDTNTKD